MLNLISSEIIHRNRRFSFIHRWVIYQFFCPILTKFLKFSKIAKKGFKVTVNYLFIKPPRKHSVNKDSTTFYSFRYLALCNLFLVVEISMSRTYYLNESQGSLPSTFSSSASHSEEGNSQICLDSSLRLYQYYFRHIRIKEPSSPRKKNDLAKFQILFLYVK